MNKLSKIFSLMLIIVFSLILTTCGDWGDWRKVDRFHDRLQGTWEAQRGGFPYEGSTISIVSTRIRITGFDIVMMNDHGHNNTQRPFSTIAARGNYLDGYSEGDFNYSDISSGFMYIEDANGVWRPAIPFIYNPRGDKDILVFEFGDYTEILTRTSF